MRPWFSFALAAAPAFLIAAAGAAERIQIQPDGSIPGRFSDASDSQAPMVIGFGLPGIPAQSRVREGDVLRTVWLTNGIRYTQTAFISTSALDTPDSTEGASSEAVLLVKIEGENTNDHYADAFAELTVQVSGKRQELALKDSLVWRHDGTEDALVAALEIPESGVKVSQGDALRFAGAIPPAIKGSMTLKIPFTTVRAAAARERLRELDFDVELRRVSTRAWESSVLPADGGLEFASENQGTATNSLNDEELTGTPAPIWFQAAPALPPPQGRTIRVRTVDQLIAAVDGLGPGESVLVEDGHYRLPRPLILDGKRQVAVRGASGDPRKVILSGQGWEKGLDGDDILHIAACEGVRLADLTFSDCRSYGIKVEGEHGPKDVQIFHCRFRNIGVRAIKGSAGNDPMVHAVGGSVRFCAFENTRVPPADWLFGGDYISAIDMMALEDWTFSDNIFHNIKGRNGGGRAAIFIWVRSRRIMVERNVIVDCDRGVAFGNPGQSTANVDGQRPVYVSDGTIRNNMIAGGADCGIELWHSTGIKVMHNSIWRPEQNFARGIRVGLGTENTEIVNNLVHGKIMLDGGSARLVGNYDGHLAGMFVDPAVGDLALADREKRVGVKARLLPAVLTDIRGVARGEEADAGAWESGPGVR